MTKHCIVFTVDNNYLPHLGTALSSFLEHHDPRYVTVGLIYSDIKQNRLDRFRNYFAKRGLETRCHEARNCFESITVGYHFNKVIFYRLLAPELFADHGRILYLDSDIIFNACIYDLFELKLGDSVLAAVDKTPFSGVPSHLKDVRRYFASGLMLIDTQKYIATKVKSKCLDFLSQHFYVMPDQDALNYAVTSFVDIDPSYSVETSFLDAGFIHEPKIIQFSGTSKPWHLCNSHPYKRQYWKFRNRTPYRSIVSDDFSLLNVLRRFIPAVAFDRSKALLRSLL